MTSQSLDTDVALRTERIYLRKGNMPAAQQQALKDAKAEIVRQHRYRGPRLHLKISRAAFQEIALLLCGSGNHKHCKPTYESGEIVRIDLPHLTFEPCRT